MQRQPAGDFSAIAYNSQQRPANQSFISEAGPNKNAPQQLPNFNEVRRQQTSQNNRSIYQINSNPNQVSGSGLQSYQTQLEPANNAATLIQNAVDSEEQQSLHMVGLNENSDSDFKRPPVAIFQEALYNLPSRQQKDSTVMFDTLKSISDSDIDDRAPRDLIFFSRKAARLHTSEDLKHALKQKHQSSLNSKFSQLLRDGVRTIAASPDCNLLAMLCQSFKIIILDKNKDTLFKISGLNKSKFVGTDIDVNPFYHNLETEMSESNLKEQFQLFVNNDASSVVVYCKIQNDTWVWSKRCEENAATPAKAKGTGNAEKENKDAKKGKNEKQEENEIDKKSHAAQERRAEKKYVLRSQSVDSQNAQQKCIETIQRVLKVDLTNLKCHQRRRDSLSPDSFASRPSVAMPGSVTDHSCKKTKLRGTWTNITLSDIYGLDEAICLSQTQCVRFLPNANQQSIQPHGIEGAAPQLVKVREDTVFTKVELFDSLKYFSMVEQALVSQPPKIGEQPDPVDEVANKILLIRQQTVKKDAISRSDILYDFPQIQVTQTQKLTQIEHLGLLEETGNCNSEINLIVRPDNQNSLLAVVTNSKHLFYCQLFFVSMETNFATCMKLFNFQQQYESPPLDRRGKANLQVDDIQWTLNDAFVLLLFSTGALAVLPRLGSQLLQMFNPTLANIQKKDVQLYEQYKHPRMFNQLIQTADVQMHVKKLKGDVKQRFRLNMHPFELAFTVYDGQVAFVMRMELEPELTELFERKNMSYYFMRFCFSMQRLATDPEILDKVPKLLTNKLPLFEVEKDLEKFENAENEVEQRVMTAAQINPFQMEDKRMETVQSFDAQFEEDPQIVLLNFKNLLFSFRWNKEISINYLQWLITVVNDCVYYFLKQSEPIYAFHTLVIAEFYVKKILHKSEGESNLFDLDDNKYLKRKKAKKQKEVTDGVKEEDEGMKLNKFIEFTTRLCDSTQEIYEYQPGHPNAKCNPAALTLKVNQKIELVNNFLTKLPQDKATVGASNFMFEKPYILIVLYSLIQFRNYQASNFNIINLLFACYIVQKYLCKNFASALTKVADIVNHNNLILDKTDEVELFFGKTGSNRMADVDKLCQIYFNWMVQTMKIQNLFHSRFYEENNLLTFTKLVYEQVNASGSTPKKTLASLQQQAQEQDKRYKTPYLNEILPVTKVTLLLQRGDLKAVVAELRTISQLFTTKKEGRILTQNLGISLTLLTIHLQKNLLSEDVQVQFAPTLGCLLHSIARSAVLLDKKSPINCISLHRKIFSCAFQQMPVQHAKTYRKQLLRQAIAAFQVDSEVKFYRVLGLLCFFQGDIEQGCQVLQRLCKPSKDASLSIDILLLRLHMLSLVYCNVENTYYLFKEKLKDFDINNVKDLYLLMRTTERLNIFHLFKFSARMLDSTVNLVMRVMGNSHLLAKIVWVCCDLIDRKTNEQLKGEHGIMAVRSLQNIFTMSSDPIDSYRSKRQKIAETTLQQKYQLAWTFLKNLLPCFSLQTLEFALSPNSEVHSRFFQQLELLLVCFQDQFKTFDSSVQIENRKLDVVFNASIRNLAKIMLYLKHHIAIQNTDKFIANLKNKPAPSTPEEDKQDKRELFKAQLMKANLLLQIAACGKVFNVQQFSKSGLEIVKNMITMSTLPCVFEYGLENELCEAIRRINIAKIGESNKDIIIDIGESLTNLETQHQDQENMKTFMDQISRLFLVLQSQIIESEASVEQMLKDMTPETQEELKFSETIMAQKGYVCFNKEVRKATVQSMVAQITQTYNELDFQTFFTEARQEANKVKATFLATYRHAQTVFGLPTSTSLFYRGSCFEQREGNIFGITETDLAPFAATLTDQTTNEIINKVSREISQVPQEDVPFDDDLKLIQAQLNENYQRFLPASLTQILKLKETRTFIQNYKAERNIGFESNSHNGEPLKDQSEKTGPSQDRPEAEVSNATPKIKCVKRKNSCKRVIAQGSQALFIKRFSFIKPMKDNKVSSENPKKADACRKMVFILKKHNVHRAIEKWHSTLPKIGNKQRFNLMILGLNKERTRLIAKNPNKLYGTKRLSQLAEEKEQIDPRMQPFNLMCVRQIAQNNPESVAEQKVFGKKVQIVSDLEKTPISVNHGAKFSLLRNIMMRIEVAQVQIDSFQKEFDSKS